MSNLGIIGKIIPIILFCMFLLGLCCLYYYFRAEILTFFEKGESLNYYNNEIERIVVIGNSVNGGRRIVVVDEDVIGQIIDYINSLKLVEGHRSRISHIHDEGSFMFVIFHQDIDKEPDVFVFTSKYVEVGGKMQGTNFYYIKNAGYNSADKSTNISRHFYELFNTLYPVN